MKERRDVFLIILSIFLFLCLLWIINTIIPDKDANQPKVQNQKSVNNTCAECHEMKPEFLTWQISSHSKVPCTSCHDKDPSDYLTTADTQNYSKPIKIAQAIPNSVCDQCHSANRIPTVSGDLIIPHEKHRNAGVSCVTCHSGMVHGKIAEQGITAKGTLSDYDNWDLQVAKKVATKYYLQPSMWTCINCHKQLKKAQECSACHKQITNLPSHENATWKTEHGKNARAEIGVCTTCHVTPGKPKFVKPSTGDVAADFAQAQEFCYNCHLQRPATHESSMIAIHPKQATEKGLLRCFTCHSLTKPAPEVNLPGTYCNQCHWFPKGSKANNSGTP